MVNYLIGLILLCSALSAYAVPREAVSMCSGFFISNNGLVLTAAHCYDETMDIFVEKDNKSYKATVLHLDRNTDLLVLKININTKDFFTVSQINQVGAEVYVLGYPLPSYLGWNLKGVTATITRVYLKDGLVTVHGSSACFGNSGGPVVNQANEVLGVASAIHGEGPCSYFLIYANSLKTIQQYTIVTHRQNSIFSIQQAKEANEAKMVIIYRK